MKTNKSHLIILALMPLVLAGCGKTSSVPAEEAATIRFAAPAETRAPVPINDFSSVFEIRDWYDDGAFVPGIGDFSSTSAYYINNTLEYGGSSWGYGNADKSYPWRQNAHLFFGWLKNDSMGASNDFFGEDLGDNLSGTTLSIPATKIDKAKNSTPCDFLYSKPVFREAADGDFSPVKFTFKHLFARVSIGFLVAGDDDLIDLKEVHLTEFANTRSATITFTEDDATVVSAAVGAEDYFIDPVVFNLSNYSKESMPIDILSQTQSLTKTLYYVWPLEEDELPCIYLRYRLPEDPVGDPDREVNVPFPTGTSWEAGNQYSYSVSYMGGLLKIVGNVQPWDRTTTTYAASAATEQPVMATWGGWDTSTCTVGGDDLLEASFQNISMDVKGRFRIYSPTECAYKISIANDTDFSLIGSEGTIGETGADYKPGEMIEFSVRANPGAASGAETTLSFTITVSWDDGGTTQRRTYSLDSEIQKDGPLKVIIP